MKQIASINFRHYETEYDDLSTRSINVINRNFKNVDCLIEYYKENKTFISLGNVGLYTEKELINFCETQLLKSLVEEKKIIIISDIFSITVDNYEEIHHEYINLKRFASSRLSNILSDLERSYNLQKIKSNQFLFDLIHGKIEFSKIRNVGVKTIAEFEVYRLKLIGLLENYKIPASILVQKNIETQVQNSLVSFSEPTELVIHILNLIQETDYFKLVEKIVIEMRFLKNQQISLQEIANICSLTRERIRQIEKRLVEHRVSKFTRIFIKTQKIGEEGIEFPNSVFIYLDPSSVDGFTPQKKHLANIILDTILKDKFSKIDVKSKILYLLKNTKHRRDFNYEIKANFIFCRNDFFYKNKIQELINWTLINIIEFNNLDFDYDLKVLIKRYYDENKFEISMSDLQLIFETFELIKLTSIIFYGRDIRRKKWL